MLTILFTLIVFVDNISIIWARPANDDIIDISHFGSKLFGKPIESNEVALDAEGSNPEENGPYLEGDLLHPSMTRNGMKAEAYRWTGGIVPFEIRGGFCK